MMKEFFYCNNSAVYFSCITRVRGFVSELKNVLEWRRDKIIVQEKFLPNELMRYWKSSQQ